jgi:phosphatidylinositol 4-kinase
MQLITYFERLFKQAKIPVWMLSYRIVSTSKNTGLIQLIPDAISLDGLKKSPQWPGTLRAHFELSYGPPDSPSFRQAMECYIQSIAAYSIVTYILAIKDR